MALNDTITTINIKTNERLATPITEDLTYLFFFGKATSNSNSDSPLSFKKIGVL